VKLISAFLPLVDYDFVVVDVDASGAGFADAGADDAVGAVVGVVAADACIDVTDYWDDRKWNGLRNLRGLGGKILVHVPGMMTCNAGQEGGVGEEMRQRVVHVALESPKGVGNWIAAVADVCAVTWADRCHDQLLAPFADRHSNSDRHHVPDRGVDDKNTVMDAID
jgi:hypothetical protein